MNGGFLSDKYIENSADPNSRHMMRPNFQSRYHRHPEIVRKYYNVAKKYDMTLQQMALTWARARFHVGSAILGATSIEQLEENMACGGLNLSKEILDEIDEIYVEHKDPNVSV